jgi:hypothetical protein
LLPASCPWLVGNDEQKRLMEVHKTSGDLSIALDRYEADLFRNLLHEMKMLLEGDIPEDAVKKRLFPRAYEDDADEASYRELTAAELEASKLEALREVRDTVGTSGPVEASLDAGQVGAWLRLLTDLRLAIGTRLEVTEETMSKDFDESDPDAAAFAVLHWLGWMQESIIERTSV